MASKVFTCPSCSSKALLIAELVGTRVKCPTCGEVFDASRTLVDPVVTDDNERDGSGLHLPKVQQSKRPSRLLTARCEQCGSLIQVKTRQAEKVVPCPTCKVNLTVSVVHAKTNSAAPLAPPEKHARSHRILQNLTSPGKNKKRPSSLNSRVRVVKLGC